MQAEPTKLKLRILRGARKLQDRKGAGAPLTASQIANEAGIDSSVVQDQMHYLSQAGWMEWHPPAAADPRFVFPGGEVFTENYGSITVAGYNIAVHSTVGARARRLLPNLIISALLAVLSSLATWAVSPPNIQQALAGIAGGTSGGGLLAWLLRR